MHFGSDSEDELCFPEEPEDESCATPLEAEDECLINLRQGKIIPERQVQKEKDRKKEKEIEAENG